MPAFNAAVPGARAVSPGETYQLFAAETVAANATSVVIAPAGPDAWTRGIISFQQHFASGPTAVVVIYGSNDAPTSSGPTNGQVLQTFTNTQDASLSDNSGFAFYWAVVSGYSAGGKLTVSAHVA